MRVLITGSSGFIGGHLVQYLKDLGYWVRGVDIKTHEFMACVADEFKLLDLRSREACVEALEDIEVVYHLAADMGGIGHITSNHANNAANNTQIDLNMLN